MTNLSIDEVGEKSREWIEMMAEAVLRKDIDDLKAFSLGMRIPPDKFKELDNIAKTQKDTLSGKNVFNDDIRLFESLGGTIEKIPKKKGEK